jgi:hypothetical protein
MPFPLTPRLHHAGFLRALICHIYAGGMRPEDYSVLARRSDLAAVNTTELLKSKSEANEDVHIAQDKLASVLRDRQRDEADLRIFLADNEKPLPRRIVGFINMQTREMREYECKRTALEDRLARSTAKLEEVQAYAKVKQAISDRAINQFHAIETERDLLRDAAIRAGIYLMLHHQASGSYGEAVNAFEEVRQRARGDRRLYIVRVFIEALVEGSNAAVTLLREFNDVFAGGSAPEAGLAQALTRAASDIRLTAHDIPPVTPENYSAPEHFVLQAMLAAAFGLPYGGKVSAEWEPLVSLAQGWFSSSFSDKALALPAQWQQEMPRSELLISALLKLERPQDVLGIFGIDLERLVTASTKRRGDELVRLTFARIADARLDFGPVFSDMGERCICLLLAALLETAPKAFYDIARQELTVASCGNAHELLRALEEGRQPRFRRLPEEFYWELLAPA